MRPQSESGWQRGPIRPKGQPRDLDIDPLPYRALSLVAMLERRLKEQQRRRIFRVWRGRIIEKAL